MLQAEGEGDERALRALPRLNLAEEYRAYAPDDLAVLASCFVLRRPAAEAPVSSGTA